MIRLIIIVFASTILIIIRRSAGRNGESSMGPFLRRTFPGSWYYKSFGRRHRRELPEVRDFLKKHFYFAGYLTPSELDDFAFRTLTVRNSKLFIDEKDMEPEDAQCLLLSASIAQLTFGLTQNYWLPSYTHIRVHPDVFYSRLVDAHVKGLTIGRRIVHISWKHYLEGISDPKSGICLGLHEFAHAMVIDPGTPVNQWDIDQWRRTAHKFLHGQKPQSPIIREYGFSNENELWAVCCELFFERALEFCQHHPDLYRAMARVLNQDTARRMKPAA
ncbi:MAG: zinc-dependent peptidase [Flavobacteriales bacterium]